MTIMNKKHLILSAVCCLALAFSSCSDYLNNDKKFKDRVTLEKVFTNRDYSEQWLANAYHYLMDYNADVASKEWTPFCFSDDMYFGDRSDRYKIWKNVEYDEGFYQNSWDEAYKGIRQASIFIQYIDMNHEFTQEERTDLKAQARFLRAYLYWKLVQKYGPVPLLPDEGMDYTDEYEDLSLPRNTYDECADYICDEMILAARDLPLKRELLSIARATRGAALATRAKVLLFAASPLINGNADAYAAQMVDDKGKRLLTAEYDESKWAKAAAAARDVMELNRYQLYTANFRPEGDAQYPATVVPPHHPVFSEKKYPEGWKDIDPFESYRAVFNGELNATDNPELIFTRGQNQGSESVATMVLHQLPRFAKGWNTHGMTQKQCDAYYMNDGRDCPGKDKEIGRGDGSNRLAGFTKQEEVNAGKYLPVTNANVSLQYVEREPRFYASVAYNGVVWNLGNAEKEENTKYTSWYYRGTAEGRTNTMFWLRTGIGIMKFVRPTDTNERDGAIDPKPEPAIRYAEVLLIYAEALNELTGTYDIPSWDGSKSYTIRRDESEMRKGILPVRLRAGVPDFNQSAYEGAHEFRKCLKRERQIELMGEGHRYFDLRRWKDAAIEEALPVYGCNTLMTSEERQMFHVPVQVSSLPTTFAEKTYFWPIKHEELKRNRRLTQNPRWTYND